MLIPKGDENLSDLKNWYPISLLNIGYKIFSKALVKQGEQHLPKLIHSDQTRPKYSNNLCVRTYIFPSLASLVHIFGGSYWQLRLK